MEKKKDCFLPRNMTRSTEEEMNTRIAEFREKFKRELDHARSFNIINALMDELQRQVGDQERCRKKLVAILDQLNKVEDLYMPLVVKTYEEKGIEEALAEFEEIGLSWQSLDLRKLGLHRLRNIPRGAELHDQYNRVHDQLREGLKRRYRNPSAKTSDIRDLFPDIPMTKIRRWSQLRNFEIAHRILAHRYDISPNTVKNLLSRYNTSLRVKSPK